MSKSLFENARDGEIDEIVDCYGKRIFKPIPAGKEDDDEEWDPDGSVRGAYRYLRVAESYGHAAATPLINQLLDNRFKSAPRGALGEVEFMVGVHQALGLDEMTADLARGFAHLERAAAQPPDLYAEAVPQFRDDFKGDARVRYDGLFPPSQFPES